MEARPEDFIPFTGTGEANFLGGVARKYGVGDRFDVNTAKARFVELYLVEAARPETRIAYPGQCKCSSVCLERGHISQSVCPDWGPGHVSQGCFVRYPKPF